MSTKQQNQTTYINRSRNNQVTDVMPEGTVRLGDQGDGTWIIEDGDGSFVRVSENDPELQDKIILQLNK